MDLNETTRERLVLTDSPDLSNDLRSKISNNVYRIRNKTGKSRVWELFGPVETDKGQEIANFVACKKCRGVFKFNNKSTSNLVKHKCFSFIKNETAPVLPNIDPETKKELQHIITKWNIESCRPYHIIADSGLQKLAEFFIATGAKYGENVDIGDLLPQPSAVSKHIEKLYADNLAKLKVEINSVRNVGYGLTTDIWSDKYLYATFLFMTIHYIKNGQLINRFLGMETIENETCTSADIKEAAQEILTEYDCTLDNDEIILTNNSDNMVPAFLSNNRIYCMNHLLNSTLEEALNITPEIAEICDTAGTLYSFLNEIDHPFKDTVEDIYSSRWNRTYNMICTLIANWNKIVETCKSCRAENAQLIECLNFNHITALANVLKPFEESFKDLNTENCITLHLVIVHVHRLRKLCVKNHDDLGVIKKFKVNLLEAFDRFILKNMSVQHKIALYLFPPTKKLISFSQTDKDLVRAECKRLIKTFVDEIESDQMSDVAHSTIQIDDKDAVMEYLDEFENAATTSVKAKITSELFSDFVESDVCLSNAEERANNEMRLYEETNVSLQDNFDLLQWWHLHQAQYPLLYKLSCKILAVPATTIAAERVLLKARSLIFESRGAADSGPDLVNEIIFLHFNKNFSLMSDVTMDKSL